MLRLLATTALTVVGMTGSAAADCTYSNLFAPGCENAPGGTAYFPRGLPDEAEDSDAGVDGSDYKVTSSSTTTISITGSALTNYSQAFAPIFVQSQGGTGSSNRNGNATRGGDGGTAEIQNASPISVTAAPNATYIYQPRQFYGFWDDGTTIGGLIAVSNAGDGGDASEGSDVSGGNGGQGGGADLATIGNSGSITLSTNFTAGALGIYGLSMGGTGGRQDSGGTDDQVGGKGGSTNTVRIVNSGDVRIAGKMGHAAWGVAGEAIAGPGGDNASNGGIGSTVHIENSGDVTIDGSAGTQRTVTEGVRGLYAASLGGDAYWYSDDGSDPGGKGGVGGIIQLTHTGAISVTYNDLSAPTYPYDTPATPTGDHPNPPARVSSDRSAGIYLLSVGGEGGAGPGGADAMSTSDAGAGGAASGATSNDGTTGTSYIRLTDASVTTQGAYVTGVIGELLGGKGGDGRNETSGADGGGVGKLELTLTRSAIETHGDDARGLVGLSIGGNGGVYADDQFTVINVGSDTSGTGATGGIIALTADAASRIATHGAHSHAVHLYSAGGVAGAADGGFAFINTADLAGGAGGSGGTVDVKGAVVTQTFGDYALGGLYQSIAGGGGDVSTQSDSSGLFVLGGGGGQGGKGGAVKLGANLTAATEGGAAPGVQAQSIGGGGGNGGNANGVVAVGGQAGSGGDGGTVTFGPDGDGAANPSLNVTTLGDYSYGMLLQSIGGGGGNGGDVFDFSVIIPAVGVGGDGGSGGDGGTAQVNLPNQGAANGTYSVATAGDNAHGLFVQSIGGGGGVGGDVSGTDIGVLSVQIAGGADSDTTDDADGAQGGGYGRNATISIHNDDAGGETSITTTGAHSIGALAQSIGGGGGTGGMATANEVGVGFSLGVAVGGDGGAGGAGGAASVTLAKNTTITTGADDLTDSHGVVAQSIGGGGGIGGGDVVRSFNQAVSIPDAGIGFGFSIAAGAGGVGGSGGAGGTASVLLADVDATTRGDGSMAVLSQSIGGGGGLGGSSSSMNGLRGAAGSVSGKVGFALGGAGGNGGDGGTATATITDHSAIETVGDYANAVVAQSVGGGGGVAGPGSAGTYPFKSGFGVSVTLTVGATGGTGGRGGGSASASLDETSTITTQGSESRGMMLQSIGGGGGASQGGSLGFNIPASGFADAVPSYTFKLRLGQTGGSAGAGASSSGRNDGEITTFGGGADGVLVQSIGGGGGLGGAVSSDVDRLQQASETLVDVRNKLSASLIMGFTVDIGGDGGSGGDGGAASFTQSGLITTSGDHADGVVVQSIGGGGGVGGSAASMGSETVSSLQLNLGGSGGAGGNGGAASLTFEDGGAITTAGYGAMGALVQSVGGGGGQGGSGSDRIVAAPGTGDDGSIQLGVRGADGVDNQDSGAVAVTGPATISTAGMNASALVLQSIAGGGGVALAGNANVAELSGYSEDGKGEGGYIKTDIATGNGALSGDDAATAGAVTFGGDVAIATTGAAAHGIVAQSIGGGGGLAPSINKTNTTIILGNGTGDGGDVSLSLTGGTLTATGVSSYGVIAQSIGGGGGVAGAIEFDQLDVLPDVSTVSRGAGGAVSITNNAAITVTGGQNAIGVFAQSIGGGGGLGGERGANASFAGTTGLVSQSSGAGGPVDITIAEGGSVTVGGVTATGIFAQSVGPEDSAPITVDVAGSVAMLGDPGVAGLAMKIVGGGLRDSADTPTNVVTVRDGGVVSSAGSAIRYVGHSRTFDDGLLVVVEDGGTLVGGVSGVYSDEFTQGAVEQRNLSAAASAIALSAPAPASGSASAIRNTAAVRIENREGGVLSGARRYGADLRNDGLLVLGTQSGIGRLRIFGDFVQGETGTTLATVDFAGGRGDVLSVGDDAALGGTLRINALSIVGGISHPLLSVDGDLSGRFDSIESGLFGFEQTVTSEGLAIRAAEARFDDPAFALSARESGVAAYLGDVFLTSDAAFGALFGDLDAAASAGSAGYAAALSGLAPGASLAGAASTFEMARSRFDAVLGCSDFSEKAVADERRCVQFLGAARRIDQDGDAGGFGYGGSVYTLGLAGRAAVSETWTLGGAIGWETSDFNGAGGFGSVEGAAAFAGISATRSYGAMDLTLAGTGSWGGFDTRRTPAGAAGAAKADHDVASLAGRVRGAYTLGSETGYLRPMVDLDLTWVSAGGYRETGAGALSLSVEDSDAVAFTATPAMEFGGVAALTETLSARAYARVGASFSTLSSYDAQAGFAGAAAGAGAFRNEVSIADVVGRVSAGVTVMRSETMDLDLRYDGAFAEDLDSHAGSVRFTFRF
ncbi:hypothetical protein SAMN05444336_104365 [Albimonas donghaensis]|uniref:Autotransporter domain-containing protein n=2 Tax=Albimonas donghaensis TaxID=356660 RepID=A0A1H3AXY6_9RHOB|nr:hypothetical protein SAMN05444336_104365 [Albimonas donghaensis]